MSHIDLVSVLHIIPQDEDYAIEEIMPNENSIRDLVGDDLMFVEVSNNIGFYASRLSKEGDYGLENFVISRESEIIDAMYGPVAFAKREGGKILDLTDDEMSIIASNLVEMRNGTRILFLDVIQEQLNEIQ